MNEVNKRTIVLIKVLSPLSIGAGAEKEWTRGVDFVVRDEMLYRLNLKKIIQSGIDVGQITSYVANRDEAALLKILGNKLADVSDFSMPMPAHISQDMPIKSFVKNELTGHPIIPGSSLKGAIRSVLFDYLRDGERKEDEVFGTSFSGDEFMRFIKISDSDFRSTVLINAKIFNLLTNADGSFIGGWKHGRNKTTVDFANEGFNTIYEAIKPGEESVSNISLSELCYKNYEQYGGVHPKSTKKSLILANGITSLFEIINLHTREYIKKEISFFEKYPADMTSGIIDELESLLDSIPEDNMACVLKMSAGSGFHSITGDWQFDDYSIDGVANNGRVNRGLFKSKPSSKSRKIAIHNDVFSLMGFVQLRIMNDEEVESFQMARAAEKAALQKSEMEKVRLAREAREIEEKRIADQRELERRYDDIINSAELLYQSSQVEKAYALYLEARDVYSEGKKHTERLQDLEPSLNLLKSEEALRIAQEKSEKELKENRLKQVEAGLASILNEKYVLGPNADTYKIKDVKLLKGKISQWLKNTNSDLLQEEYHEIVFNTLKRLYALPDKKEVRYWLDFNDLQIWGGIVTFVGEDKAKEWYDSLVSTGK